MPHLLLLGISSTDAAAVANDRGLSVVDEGQLRAYGTAVRQGESPWLGREAMLAHHDVVSRLHTASGGLVPARFPTLIDEAALRAHLRDHRAAYVTAVARVQGRVELAVTATWDGSEPVSAEPPEIDVTRGAPGLAYMRRRQATLTREARLMDDATRLADALEGVLPPGAEVGPRRICPSPAIALSVAYLVPGATAVDVGSALRQVQAGVRILISGPWPPYSFATVVREA